jgi:hypothetical protein
LVQHDRRFGSMIEAHFFWAPNPRPTGSWFQAGTRCVLGMRALACATRARARIPSTHRYCPRCSGTFRSRGARSVMGNWLQKQCLKRLTDFFQGYFEVLMLALVQRKTSFAVFYIIYFLSKKSDFVISAKEPPHSKCSSCRLTLSLVGILPGRNDKMVMMNYSDTYCPLYLVSQLSTLLGQLAFVPYDQMNLAGPNKNCTKVSKNRFLKAEREITRLNGVINDKKYMLRNLRLIKEKIHYSNLGNCNAALGFDCVRDSSYIVIRYGFRVTSATHSPKPIPHNYLADSTSATLSNHPTRASASEQGASSNHDFKATALPYCA